MKANTKEMKRKAESGRKWKGGSPILNHSGFLRLFPIRQDVGTGVSSDDRCISTIRETRRFMVRSYLLLLFCVTCWGSNFVFGSMLVHEFPPLLLSAFRLTMTSLSLFIYAWGAKKLVRPARRD